MKLRHQHGVSIITCTNRPQFFWNIIDNYKRQHYKVKELIIILNKDRMRLNKYLTRKYKNVFVYKMPENVSLGRCLNYAISKTNIRLSQDLMMMTITHLII